MLDVLKTTFYRLLESVNNTTFRYLYHQFNLNDRLSGIIGPRGVGKTTLMLQYIKNHLLPQEKIFYFSADHIYFNKVTLIDFIEELYQTEGIKIFFIDEIHKYQQWNQELKNIYDANPALKIVFSGSSSIDLVKGAYDLSRRATLYQLNGLSFREFIYFKTQKYQDVIYIKDLLQNYNQYDQKLSTLEKVKGDFLEYCQYGYYPFYFESSTNFYDKINRVIDKTIYEDISNYYNLKTENLHYFKKILNFLTTIPPGKINANNLAKHMGVDAKTALNYLHILSETSLVNLLYPNAQGNQLLRKPEKVFIHNTTLMCALHSQLGQPVEKGTVRELFFIQSFKGANIPVYYSDQGDFESSNTIFELGGKNKTRHQIKNARHAAVIVKDDILTSSLGVIPLYYFGFLY